MKRLALLLMVMVLCTSCATLPGEERCFALVLCMETDNGLFSVSARVPSYQKAGDYLTLSAQGTTLQEALAQLDGLAPMRLHYGQLRLITVGRDLASSEHFIPALTLLFSRADFRADAALCITEDSPQAICDAMVPQTGTRLSKALDVLLETRRALGLIPATTLGQVQQMGERQCPTAVALSLGEDEQEPIQLEGAYLINADGQVQGRLTSAQTQVLSLLSGRFKKGMLMLPEGTVTLTDASASADLRDGWIHVRVSVRFGTTSLTAEGVQEGLTRAVFELSGLLADARCDALGLARYAIRSCADAQAWAEMDWPVRYPGLPWRVGVMAAGEARTE